ncbi:lipoprotein signal peptidase [Polystyrenella longa]|uniref:Lipoprotein signal peptidase n=1 Tax=Polystyrenella longa TaxID=2528007 RepID=A0A518CPB1_9PLAN|nr:signal peptidase II [Polystyrenella longa]QDU81059.1 lipoprotein signal peptidase [Polystyrenella longa]
MKPETAPTRRYPILFCVLVLCATFFDIYSKDVVFADLGFPGGAQTLVEGKHEIFTNPAGADGQSVLYMDNWIVFQLYNNFNFGALWGLGQGMSLMFGLFGGVAIVGILVWAFYFNGVDNLWLTISLGLILAGAFGNLWDRMGWHGYEDHLGNPIYAVRDFLFFRFGGRDGYPWPIFNFADTYLVVGAAMMFIHSLFMSDSKQETETVAVSTVSEKASSPS